MECGARLSPMGIKYEDQREDVAVQHYVLVLVRLKINLTIVDCFRQAQIDDKLPEQWFAWWTYSDMIKDADGLHRMRGRLYVPDVPTHPGLHVDILPNAH